MLAIRMHCVLLAWKEYFLQNCTQQRHITMVTKLAVESSQWWHLFNLCALLHCIQIYWKPARAWCICADSVTLHNCMVQRAQIHYIAHRVNWRAKIQWGSAACMATQLRAVYQHVGSTTRNVVKIWRPGVLAAWHDRLKPPAGKPKRPAIPKRQSCSRYTPTSSLATSVWGMLTCQMPMVFHCSMHDWPTWLLLVVQEPKAAEPAYSSHAT